MKYENITTDLSKESERWFETMSYHVNEEDTGVIQFIVRTVGDDYPVAYYLKCEFGILGHGTIWESDALGYASRDKMLGIVKKTIDEMIEELAIIFYKVRGEL